MNQKDSLLFRASATWQELKRLPGKDDCMEVVFNGNDWPYVLDFFGRSKHVCPSTQKGHFYLSLWASGGHRTTEVLVLPKVEKKCMEKNLSIFY